MYLSRLRLPFILFSVTFVCCVSIDSIPDEVIPLVQEFLKNEHCLLASSARLRQLLLPHAVLPLNREYSRRYIQNESGFRDDADRSRTNTRKQVRLNLGCDFREYIVNERFRSRVNALVEVARDQIWSNIEYLNLQCSQGIDITGIAALVNLQMLNLMGCQLHDISVIDALINLRQLDLARTGVVDISPLRRLGKLRQLNLSDTRVQDVSALSGLINMNFLDLRGTQVQDMAPLSGLINLRLYF